MSVEDGSFGVPASIEAAWGVRSRPGYGPRPGLSLDRIVDTAVRLAASEGLAAVSMVRVAKELGASTMALYRYVAAKDELLDLMLDAGVGVPPAEPADGRDDAGWRDRLDRWSRDYLDVLRANGWMLQVPVTAPPITPNQIAWLERGLTGLRGTPVTERERLSVVMLLAGFVRGWAGLTVPQVNASHRKPIDYGRALLKLTDARRFPAITAAITAGAIDDELDDPDAEFTFGLDRMLDGVETLIRNRT